VRVHEYVCAVARAYVVLSFFSFSQYTHIFVFLCRSSDEKRKKYIYKLSIGHDRFPTKKCEAIKKHKPLKSFFFSLGAREETPSFLSLSLPLSLARRLPALVHFSHPPCRFLHTHIAKSIAAVVVEEEMEGASERENERVQNCALKSVSSPARSESERKYKRFDIVQMLHLFEMEFFYRCVVKYLGVLKVGFFLPFFLCFSRLFIAVTGRRKSID
jgi:hypothetical protein